MQNEDPFFLNDRNGKKPNMETTLEGISMLMTDKITILKKPFIMASRGTPEVPKIEFKAPYFEGKNVNVNIDFKKNDKFIFYIIANTFKDGVFASHALIGYWNGSVLTVFDPNGDFYTEDTFSVYNGYGFFKAPQTIGVKNPLYNTLINYFKTKVNKIKIYDGDIILCPRNSSNTCAYRSFMYMLSLIKANGDIGTAIKYTKLMAMNKLNEIKELIKLSKTLIDLKRFPLNNKTQKDNIQIVLNSRNQILDNLGKQNFRNNRNYKNV